MPPTDSRKQQSITKPRILACESDKTNRYLLEKIFLKKGYVAEVVDDDAALLARLMTPEVKYDLIIINVCKPNKDEFSLIKAIQSLSKDHGHSVPIMATSTAIYPDIKKRCQEKGIIDVIMKPFDIEALTAMIEGCISQYKNPVVSGDSNSDILKETTKHNKV